MGIVKNKIASNIDDSRFFQLEKKLENIEKQNTELLWANYFRDSIVSAGWVVDKSFSAVGGAANYSLLYKMFKVLDIVKPNTILEFGLGQSTNLTRQYCASNNSVFAVVLEHNEVWANTYRELTKNIDNIRLEITPTEDYRLDDGTVGAKDTQYKDIRKILKRNLGKKKLDFVVIDGPIGVDKQYSRTDILNITDLLDDTFVIIIDDSNRPGEQMTIDLLTKKLHAKNKKFSSWTVNGMKQQTMITSPDVADVLWAI